MSLKQNGGVIFGDCFSNGGAEHKRQSFWGNSFGWSADKGRSYAILLELSSDNFFFYSEKSFWKLFKNNPKNVLRFA